MTREEMYNKMKTLDGYGVIKRFKDGSKNFYFYERFECDTMRDTFDRLTKQGITPENDLILHFNSFFNTIFMIDKVYKVDSETVKKYDLWYDVRITKTVFDAPITYEGPRTIDSAFNY